MSNTEERFEKGEIVKITDDDDQEDTFGKILFKISHSDLNGENRWVVYDFGIADKFPPCIEVISENKLIKLPKELDPFNKPHNAGTGGGATGGATGRGAEHRRHKRRKSKRRSYRRRTKVKRSKRSKRTRRYKKY